MPVQSSAMSGERDGEAHAAQPESDHEQHDPERELPAVDARVGEERRRAEVRRIGVGHLEVTREVQLAGPELGQPDRCEPTSECHRDGREHTRRPRGERRAREAGEQRGKGEEEEQQLDRPGAQIARPGQRDRRERDERRRRSADDQRERHQRLASRHPDDERDDRRHEHRIQRDEQERL